MKNKVILLFLTMIWYGQIYAQNNSISGTVRDASDAPLPGVSIIISGTSQGTVTDIDGKYSLSAPPNATLIFSYIGHQTQTIEIQNRSQIDVMLNASDIGLEEVVVTALGIKREAKTLGFSTTTVDGELISDNRTPNFADALQGKVAGVNISSMSTGPGGTSKIRIRGQSSFSGQNNPLVVINGVPMDNSNYSLGGNYGNRQMNNSDGGDGLLSINPDDIETLTVLKGATAGALYGSRAKDGVIMITTKSKNSSKGLGVEINSNFTTDTPLDFTDFQYEYGQGEGGVRPTSAYPTSGVWSFGEKFEPGMTQILFDNEEWPYEPVHDRISQFYNVGTNWTNTVTVANSGENGGFSLSFANTDNKSIVPNSELNRKTINLGFSQNITDKLVASGNANYSHEANQNPPQVNAQDFSTATVIMTLANSMPFEALRNNITHPNGDEVVMARFLVRNNPYYSTSKRFDNVKRDRLIGNVSLNYQFTPWLYAMGRLSMDFYVRDNDYNTPNGYAPIPPAPAGFVNGSFTQDTRRFRETNHDFLIGANRTFGNFNIDLTMGGNQRFVRMDYNSVAVKDFVIPGLYTVMNGRVKDPLYSLSERKINSLYGLGEFSYKEWLFLNLTARNDWFSTLAPANRSIMYPSVATSFVFSQAFQNLPEWLYFGKFRMAYAEVGDDNVSPYSNALFYAVDNNLFPNPDGLPSPLGRVNASTVPNTNLKPLRVQETEIGMELRLFDEKLNLDFAYYHKITNDQILATQISDASSFTNQLVNIGRSMNKGLEVLVSGAPIRSEKFRWDVSVNATYNTSEVLQLGLTEADTMITVSSGGGRILRQVVGQPIGQIYTFTYLRDDQGRMVFDENSGRPLRNDEPQNMGSVLPKYYGGISNTFTYKGLSLYTLIDFKLGHKMIAGRNQNYLRHGLHKNTLNGRDQGFVVGDGVNPNGEINTTQSLIQPFYETTNVLGINEDWVSNAGFWKLRQVSLSYDFSKHLPEKLFIKQLRLSGVANNVLILKKWTQNMDPENISVTSDNANGMDFWPALPPTRSLGFNLNVKF
ncbi:SusC/RagA family TonB-linked outer membrane protein [Cyclobacterium marinum]|uniref:SusC/RagA family TonB-linked outer membrane protein n=1 Tax=Cyclobacterium marinum TaxID=104 RepID=UPI0011EC3476|nr:SusC/RagA family TonB-linked outer membrane protein [Cyclobacterium marinum]MBI0401840.1 SusC/RagA family TonB-linked outer membrane protein [Cyclobacterium marinum]